MRACYQQLGPEDRAAIMIRLRDGHSLRNIATMLNRSPSSISREVSRNHTWQNMPYEAGRAGHRAHMARYKRHHTPKLMPDSPLFKYVSEQLQQSWSPQQIAGKLKRMQIWDASVATVSHETIYTALYALPKGELRRELIACLRQGHIHRRKRSSGQDRRQLDTADMTRLSIHMRPPEVADRLMPGHWEGDFIKGAFNRTAVGTLVERTSRLVLLAKMAGLTSLHALDGFSMVINGVPAYLRKSLTYDNGSEMARHQALTDKTGMDIYFADPYSPWQRGSNENTNGLIRQYLPKGADLSLYSQEDLNAIAFQLNTRPRKVLGFRTPLEVLMN